MFILVNYSDDFGLEHCGNFETRKEAFEYIADSVCEFYADVDIMSYYPFDNMEDSLLYESDNVQVFVGNNWCNCIKWNKHYDNWLIIEI